MTSHGPSSGETDLATMLAGLEVEVRPGVFTIVSTEDVVPAGKISAMVTEQEGRSVVLEVSIAREYGLPVNFEASWLTLQVHSSLEAVGLTAAVSVALGDAGIPCNILAGFFHDHILVPFGQCVQAITVLQNLRQDHILG